MKLERVPEYLTTAVALLAGMAFAIFAGRLTGQGQVNLIVTILLAAFATGIVLTLRGGIWILIPAFWVMTGRVPVLPLPFALRDLVVMFTFAAFAILIALKVVRRKPQYEFIDLLALVLLLYLASAFVRNPVGTYAMGSARVGGKPYFDTFIAVLAYLVLIRCSLARSWAMTAPILFSIGSWIQGILGLITFHIPATVPFLSNFYTGINTDAYDAQDISRGRLLVEDRQMHLSFISNSFVLALCSYFRPLSTLIPLHFWRFVALMIAVYTALKSGHRSVILEFGMIFLVASYFRRGWGDVFRLLAVGLPILFVLILLQGNVIELPKAGQRALSFLPGNWNRDAVDDAEHSTNWRLEMWELALTTNKYIENKVLGDGFGFPLREYEAMVAATTGMGDASQENALRSGTFHSGPISTIRVIGYVGLVMYITLLLLMMRKGAQLIRKAKDTPLLPVVLFVCLPIVTEPARFILIFGAFDVSLPNTLLNLGLLKLLSNTLSDQAPAPLPEKSRKYISNRRPWRAVEPALPRLSPRKFV